MDLVPKETWPELLPFLFQCTQNSDPRMVEAGLLIFAQLAGSVMDALKPYIATLHGVLMHCLKSEKPEVAVAAARATSSFIQSLDDASQRDQFQVLAATTSWCRPCSLQCRLWGWLTCKPQHAPSGTALPKADGQRNGHRAGACQQAGS